MRRVGALCGLEQYKNRLLFSAGEKPYLALRLRKGDDTLRCAEKLISDFEAAYETTEGGETPPNESKKI